MNEYQLIDYFDMYKDESGAWTVNNLCKIGEPITITDDATELDIINYLKSINYLGENADDKNVRIEWLDDYFIELVENETDLPLGRLERIGA